jgi:hypothetical protein
MAYRPFKQTFRRASLLIVLADAHGQTVGYGVTGRQRPDVVTAYKDKNVPGDNGWTGFAKRDSAQFLRAYAYVSGSFVRCIDNNFQILTILSYKLTYFSERACQKAEPGV